MGRRVIVGGSSRQAPEVSGLRAWLILPVGDVRGCLDVIFFLNLATIVLSFIFDN
jgi:hypothetical protein